MNKMIDFVLTWVDGNDPEWQKQMNYYKNQSMPEADRLSNNSGSNRFRDWDLLRYWFRGVEKNAPWVHKIHFVTCGQKPEWLNTEHPKLVLVDHKDFIPEKYLPTFNSSTIMMNLGRIPDLSEHFVNFNDDLFLIDRVKESDFFQGDKACDSAIMGTITGENSADIFPHCLINNIGVLNQHFSKKEVLKRNRKLFYSLKYGKQLLNNLYLTPFGFFTGFHDTHLPSGYFKSCFEEVWEKEEKRLDLASYNKFRSKDDYNEWLVKNWQYCSGKTVPRSTKWGRCFQLGQDTGYIEAIKNKSYKAICINDSYTDKFSFDEVQKELAEAFESIFPQKSSYEL